MDNKNPLFLNQELPIRENKMILYPEIVEFIKRKRWEVSENVAG